MDRDGIQDSGEPGINNVRLNLFLDNGDGMLNHGHTTLCRAPKHDAPAASTCSRT